MRYFVTGTDTNCGKTYVTRLLIDCLSQQKVQCMALKPVASGCYWSNDQWMNEDIVALTKSNPSDMQINKWLFKEPIAPHLAARFEQVEITAQAISEFCQSPEYDDYDITLIEGAGGLMVPLNESETWLDFVRLATLPLILVVGIRLGCINHALLLNDVIRTHRLPCAGWIANRIDDTVLYQDEIINTLDKKMTVPLLADIPYGCLTISAQDKKNVFV